MANNPLAGLPEPAALAARAIEAQTHSTVTGYKVSPVADGTDYILDLAIAGEFAGHAIVHVGKEATG